MKDLQIYEQSAQLLESGEGVALITVASTTGSTPGKVGYKMLVWGSGPQTAGTVGGGATEAEAIEAARKMLGKAGRELVRFELAAGSEMGICGGTVEFLVESFDKNDAAIFRKLWATVNEGRRGIVISLISPAHNPVPSARPAKRGLLRAGKMVFEREEEIEGVGDLTISSEAKERIRALSAREESGKVLFAEGVEALVETIAEQPMLIIFGAGHLACEIARLAGPLSFRVMVCDEREEYANRGRFPEADNIVVESYTSVFDKIEIGKNSYIVIVTRGHKCDETVLERAVMTDARYIGMIGSRNKTLTIMRSLRGKGISAEKLARVYSPIGIAIGAVTPEEIALSIVCELTKIRRVGDAVAIGHMKREF